MKVKSNKVYLFAFILFIWVFVYNFINGFISCANIINYLFWIGFLVFCYITFKTEYKRLVYKDIIFKDVIVFMLLYIIIYYLLGFVVGFEKSPLSFCFLNILKNLVLYVGLRFFLETVKFYLIKENNSKLFVYFITLLFIVFNIDFKYLISLYHDSILFFEYICQTIIPLTIFGILGTYLIKYADLKTCLMVQLIPIVLVYIVPFAPDLDWYLYSVFHIVFSLLMYLVIRYEVLKREYNVKSARGSVLTLIPFFIIFILSILFVLGVFKYVPLGVMSNSMKPHFERGDAVIYAKIKDIDSIKIDDIICYQSEDKKVMHRVVKLEEIEGEKYFTTKGDNLSTNDPFKVTEEQVVGEIKLVIPKLGYPSVWLYELLK